MVSADIAGLVERAGSECAVGIVAVDMPIGLPDSGSRQADLLARTLLPTGRKSSVFPTPIRAATAPATHPEASAVSREATGKGISIQAFHLIPKILEVDALVRSAPPYTLIEVHPEVGFATIDPSAVVASKATPEGRQSRADALRSVGLRSPELAAGRGYGVDDLLDACVAGWTARRYAVGAAVPLPDPPEVFSDGVAAAIWH
jgi:predicted RNase H-like nuclease